ncbi:MAG: acyl-CoA thioesterase [Bacteroidales bacterium]|jgi:acyl-CoA thioester hydrolase|nr:acyl-CoA thioesterase [Bacteroidales bacterium]
MKELIIEKEIKVRFSEVDSMGVVWHGAYAKYFEDAREAFGDQYGLSYLFVFHHGFFTPLVSLEFKYKSVIRYGDQIKVIGKFINTEAAKIIFEYEIINLTTDKVATTGKSIQAFLNKDYQLVLYPPPFYLDWKNKTIV